MCATNHPDLEADGSPSQHIRHDEARIFGQYAAIIRRLRAEDGCPWDKKQSLQSLRRFIVEESFELLAAINEISQPSDDSTAHDPHHTSLTTSQYAAVADELGDVLLVTLLLGDALEMQSGLSLEEILVENGKKLIRRHPHVFDSVEASTPEQVVSNWQRIKTDQEGRSTSVAHVGNGLPPLERAFEIQKKASKVGFDWETVGPALHKLKEEIAELEQRMEERSSESASVRDNPGIEEELGDILFSAVNVTRHLKSDPSVALARTNEKFLRRFRYIEQHIAQRHMSLENASLELLDHLWDEAKKQEGA
jgi:tetrapyrrole methylase family protein/MazG family protein